MVTFVQYVLSCHLSQSLILFQSNILRFEGHCYLIDFGIAKMPMISTLTTFAKMVHCGWAAPELDQQPRSKKSDIFSFACTIYEVLVSCLFLWLVVVIQVFVRSRCLPGNPPMKGTVVWTIARNHLCVQGVWSVWSGMDCGTSYLIAGPRIRYTDPLRRSLRRASVWFSNHFQSKSWFQLYPIVWADAVTDTCAWSK